MSLLDDVLNNPNANTLIQCAAAGNTSLVRMTLDMGVDVNAVNNGRVALVEAAMSNHTETVEFLLNHGADVNKRGTGGNTALNMAVIEGNEKLVALLLEKGADPEIKNVLGRTALIEAAGFDHKDILVMLLNRGGKVNETSAQGTTALMVAAAWHTESVEVIRLLLEAGADPLLKNDKGETALDIALRTKHEKAAKALQDVTARLTREEVEKKEKERAAFNAHLNYLRRTIKKMHPSR